MLRRISGRRRRGPAQRIGSTGEPHPDAANVDGAILVLVRADKETACPSWSSLAGVGGWWSRLKQGRARQSSRIASCDEVANRVGARTPVDEDVGQNLLSSVCCVAGGSV